MLVFDTINNMSHRITNLMVDFKPLMVDFKYIGTNY